MITTKYILTILMFLCSTILFSQTIKFDRSKLEPVNVTMNLEQLTGKATVKVVGEDFYVCRKTTNGWSKAKNMGALINTSSEEGGANFSKDGKYFFFARELKETPDKDGIWSIYYVESKFLKLEELFNN